MSNDQIKEKKLKDQSVKSLRDQKKKNRKPLFE
jgi:hypothetical protein